MMRRRSGQVLLNITSNIFLQVTTAVCGLILPPLLIGYFGSAINGMVQSISQFVAYLNLVEAGIGGAAVVALFRPLAENDTVKVNQILSATRRFYIQSGYWFSLLVLLLAAIYPFIIRGDIDKGLAGVMVIILGSTGVVDFFLLGKYRVLLTADKKSFVLVLIQALGLITYTVATAVLISRGATVVEVYGCAFLIYLLRFVLIVLYVRGNYKSFNYKSQDSDANLLTQRSSVLVHQVNGLVLGNLPVVLLTLFLSLESVSVYATYNMVFLAISGLLSSFVTGINAFFGESLVKDDQSATRRLHGRYESVYFAALFWTYGVAALTIMNFMTVYTQNMTDMNYIQPELAWMLVFAGGLNRLRAPGDVLIAGAGHFSETKYRAILESVITLVASIVLIQFIGLLGVVCGQICSALYRTTDVIWYSNRHVLRQSPLRSFSKLVLVSAVFLPCIFGLSFFVSVTKSYLDFAYQLLFVSVVLLVPGLVAVALCTVVYRGHFAKHRSAL